MTDLGINDREDGISAPSSSLSQTPAGSATEINFSQQHWNGVTAEVRELQGPGRHLEKRCSDCVWFALCLEELGGRIEMRDKPHSPAPHKANGKGLAYLIPAGQPIWECAEKISFARRIFLFFDTEQLEDAGHDTSLLQQLSGLSPFTAPAIRQIAAMLADETQSGGPHGRLYSESLAMALTAALLRPGGKPPSVQKGGLSPRPLQRVLAHLEEHWCGQISLADLARIAGVSTSHFGRAFKTSTGVAPFRWQMNIRIQRAQEMLLQTRLPLTDIALTTGFSDQSHFTRAFRQGVGISPGVWRKAHTG